MVDTLSRETKFMRPRRALLYMPATDWRKIEKAATELDVDCVCLDLEDGAALNRKAEARETAVRALSTLDFGRGERLVRINPVGSGLEIEDLNAVVPAKPDGIVIPKVVGGEDIRSVSATIAVLESTYDLPQGGIVLFAIVESALGIINLREIANADERLAVLVFGAEDLAGDVGAKRTREAHEVFYARSALVTHAAAFGLEAIDMVLVDFNDMDALRTEAHVGAGLGYIGKQVIHPKQIGRVQAAFTPTAEEIAAARRIVAAHAEHQRQGTGAFALDGRMVDMPVVKAAERVLARGEAIQGRD
jgi:citrate lyase beta subunit